MNIVSPPETCCFIYTDEVKHVEKIATEPTETILLYNQIQQRNEKNYCAALLTSRVL